MREIKFRAFDKDRKDMEYINDLYWFEEQGVLDSSGEGHYANYILMQYTGLKDKNGKEIYEGDVVKGKNYGFNNPTRFIGIVEYSYNRFRIIGTPKYKGMNDDLNTTYEVIGNIYENPELIV